MPLNKTTGNMYEWVTHTWNAIKGKCPHDCSYCYMKRWGEQKPVHLDEKELKTNLGSGHFIFVGSSCDMFAEDVHCQNVKRVLEHCCLYKNKYLFQTKNPEMFYSYGFHDLYPPESTFCVTLETNRYYPELMGHAPSPITRISDFSRTFPNRRMITIEPIMDFDISGFVGLLRECQPDQVNIGADSGRHNLPEPPGEKILALIAELEQFTKVVRKKNLRRLIHKEPHEYR